MKIIEQEEGIEQGNLLIAEGPLQMDTRPLDRRSTFNDLFDAQHLLHGIPPIRKTVKPADLSTRLPPQPPAPPSNHQV